MANVLLESVADGVATLTMNRPESLNALSEEMLEGFLEALPRLASDSNVGSVIVTGAGKAFCAGGDIKGMGKRDPRSQKKSTEEKIADLKERQRTLTGTLWKVEKPTVAALPGPAAGAGLAIALACDVRIAAESAIISTGYARVGLSGDYGITWLLTRLVGTARARELMFTADRVDAATCQQIGLINRIVPDVSLQDEAFLFSKQLANGPRIALQHMKENLEDALHAPFLSALDGEAERLISSAQTNDHKEAVLAFIEKRDPKFTGT